jgi:YhcH/YjgK/YiaL family protein
MISSAGIVIDSRFARMILASLADPHAFAHCSWFDHVRAFLAANDGGSMAAGTYDVADGIRVIIADDVWREEAVPLEAHRQFVDVQIAIDGSFDVLWKELQSCVDVIKSYDSDADVELYADAATTRCTIGEGQAAIFYPTDAHAPQPPLQRVRKAVFKVPVTLL